MNTEENELNNRIPKLKDTVLRIPIESMCRALRDEVSSIQSDPARVFEITEGRWVYGDDSGHLYTFKTDVALPIPPETPVRVQIED